jgi:ketosteroid isomerase-like protein
VLGQAMDAAKSPVFATPVKDPLAVGISGPRPDRYRRECAMILEMIEEVWNGRFFDKVADYFADTCVCQTVRMRRVMGIAPFQMEIMSLIAAVPDGVMEVRDIVVHESPDLGLRVAIIWLMKGTYSGTPLYGPTNRAPLNILGSSHFEFRRGKIVREYRIYDEIAMIAQILAGGGREAAAPQ